MLYNISNNIFEKYKYIIIPIFISILIIILLLIYYNTNKYPNNDPNNEPFNTINQESTNPTNPKCACVFDIDDTITCSLDKAREAIKKCKDHKCIIAFNTARTIKYYDDVDLKTLGLTHKDFEHFYTGDHDKLTHSPSEYYLHNHIANTKIKHLQTIKDKFNIPNPKNIILFDDNYLNITKAKEHGFSTIHANDIKCGLTFNVLSDIDNILDKKYQ